jgi:hypothetical protein
MPLPASIPGRLAFRFFMRWSQGNCAVILARHNNDQWRICFIWKGGHVHAEKEMLRLRENPPRLPSAQDKADLDGIFKTALTRAWGL